MEGRTVAHCRCDMRKLAEGERWLLYWHERRAWYFTDSPPRRMTPLHAYMAFKERAEEYPHADHRGEPTTYICCPWCGGDLPNTEDIRTPQADGGDDPC